MRKKKRLLPRGLEVYFPLAVLCIGLLIMAIRKPVAVQASPPVPMPQVFAGEYSFDRSNWYPLEAAADLSALDGELYLRGHFEMPIYADSRLYFYSNHITGELFIDGELSAIDALLEFQRMGIPIQPALCARAWNFWYFQEDLPPEALVEIHLKNPHSFGNESAYRDFLSTLYSTPNDPSYLAGYLSGFGRPLTAVGMILVIVGILLLGAGLSCLVLGAPSAMGAAKMGLLALFSGGFFLLDTVDLSFRSGSNVLNTYGWQICMMYGVYLLGIMAKDGIRSQRRRIASAAMAVSALVNGIIVLISFSGRAVIYDLLPYWVYAQLLLCPILMLCCAVELIKKETRSPFISALLLLLFSCVILDILGVGSSLYSGRNLTKMAFIAFFLYLFFLSTGKILKEHNASARAQRLEKELEESRISLMLSQIHPHFIFNVLGTIRGLCRENPAQAWQGLGDFSNYLRGNMNALTNATLIPFDTELRHVEAYLRLEQMRMSESLSVVYDIQEQDFLLPPLTIQPLVENAVKHGIRGRADGGTVTIRSRREERRIVIAVEDNGVGFDPQRPGDGSENQDHIGLKNVQKRVEKMLSGTLRIHSEPARGTTVVLEFPIP